MPRSPSFFASPSSASSTLPSSSSKGDSDQVIRSSCDQCRKRKLRCPGLDHTQGVCERCASRGEDCTFSVRKRMGRPPSNPASASHPLPSPSPTRDVPPQTTSGSFEFDSASTSSSAFGSLLLTPVLTPQPGMDLCHLNDHLGWPSFASTPIPLGMCETPNALVVNASPGLAIGEFDFGAFDPVSLPSVPGIPQAQAHEPARPREITSELSSNRVRNNGMSGFPAVATTACPQVAHDNHNQGTTQAISATPSSNVEWPVSASPASKAQDLECFCHSTATLQHLRATLRTVTSCSLQPAVQPGQPEEAAHTNAMEAALEASNASSRRCIASLSCEMCASDPSTPITAFSAASLAVQILGAAVPPGTGLNTCTQHCPVAIGLFTPSPAMARRLVLAALEGEVKELTRSIGLLFEHCGNSGDEVDNTMCDRLRRQLKDIERRVSSLRSDLDS